MTDPYKVLGVSASAERRGSKRRLQKACEKISSRPGIQTARFAELASEKMKEINEGVRYDRRAAKNRTAGGGYTSGGSRSSGASKFQRRAQSCPAASRMRGAAFERRAGREPQCRVVFPSGHCFVSARLAGGGERALHARMPMDLATLSIRAAP